jgi:magnesium chelatase subunit H
VRTLAEQVELETRTRTLNPLWYEGMLSHVPYEGVRHSENHVPQPLGWSADDRPRSAPWIYQRIGETFVLDRHAGAPADRLNPKASARMPTAARRRRPDFWNPMRRHSPPALPATDIEDRLKA